jgi:hypothetical protein
MMRKKLTFAFIAGWLCLAFLASGWLAQPAAATTGLADWPRTPVWATGTALALTAQAAQPTPKVGTIAVRVSAPPPLAWASVEWQDGFGKWHAVETWPGPLDAEGRTVRWVREEHFGLGPFRWVIYEREGGATWGTSAPFYMPLAGGEWVEATVTALPTPTPTATPKRATAPRPTATPRP